MGGIACIGERFFSAAHRLWQGTQRLIEPLVSVFIIHIIRKRPEGGRCSVYDADTRNPNENSISNLIDEVNKHVEHIGDWWYGNGAALRFDRVV